jgi:alpha-galactosidase
VVAVGWSGQWEASFDRPEQGVIHLRAGQQTTHFSLDPGETIRTPRILLVFWEGSNPLRGNNLLRQVLLAHHLPRRGGELVFPPVCASVTNVDPDGTYEGPHVRVMPALAKRGIEVFWSDMDPQQWYPEGFPKGTGTWEVDTAKYPNGLKPVGEAAKASGLGYLLWFEPERVAAGTRIATEHPEWVSGGEDGGLFKLHLPEARKYLLETIDRHVTDAQLTWVRWDFNIEPLKYWRECDTPDRQGITEIRYIEGLYAFWDELRRRHPGLVIDNCASGGRRIDLETCMRSLPLWHSDLQCFGIHPGADQLQNGGLFRWIPFHGCGNFGYEPSYVFRSALTGGNILASSSPKGGLSTADEDTEQAVKRSAEVSKTIRPFLLGDFYPLFPHTPAEDVWYGYQFHREDLRAGVAVVFRREKAPENSHTLSLQGIDSSKRYEVWSVENQERRPVQGAGLSMLPVEIREAPGSTILYYAVSED